MELRCYFLLWNGGANLVPKLAFEVDIGALVKTSSLKLRNMATDYIKSTEDTLPKIARQGQQNILTK